MVIAYKVGGVHKGANGRNYRTVSYVRSDLTTKNHEALLNKHRKVKTTLWGGLHKDGTPKANSLEEATLMMANKQDAKKDNDKKVSAVMKAAASKGKRLRISARKGHFFNKSPEEVMKEVEAYKKPAPKPQQAVHKKKNRPNQKKRKAMKAKKAAAAQ